ncbi:MAG TPA: SH3 domain-containing protein [Stellaceae bacterium]|nr:SH3 domain-containing protein [Stellaceae bacterium]
MPHLRSEALRRAIIALITATLFLGAAHAAEKSEPLPRFVSLRADVVNLRTGPGGRYPVEWVYRRKGLPVEILAQHDQWRQVRDWQGTEGWVHERLVTNARTVIVKGAQRVMRAEPEAKAPPVAKLDPGVIARLLECRNAWCRIEADSIKGWLRRDEIWGVYPDEVVR